MRGRSPDASVARPGHPGRRAVWHLLAPHSLAQLGSARTNGRLHANDLFVARFFAVRRVMWRTIRPPHVPGTSVSSA